MGNGTPYRSHSDPMAVLQTKKGLKGTNLRSTLTFTFRNIVLLTHFLRQRFFTIYSSILSNTLLKKSLSTFARNSSPLKNSSSIYIKWYESNNFSKIPRAIRKFFLEGNFEVVKKRKKKKKKSEKHIWLRLNKELIN